MGQKDYENREYEKENSMLSKGQLSEEEYDELERRKRRQQKIAKMRREKERYERRMKLLLYGIPSILVLCVLIFVASSVIKHRQATIKENESWTPTVQKSPLEKQEDGQVEDVLAKQEAEGNEDGTISSNSASMDGEGSDSQEGDLPTIPTSGGTYSASEAENMTAVDGEVVSSSVIVIDRDTNTIISQRGGKDRINPASMTKILTVLVAAEHINNLEDPVTITRDVTDFSFSNDCSIVGFDVDETVTVKDLMYGTILPSGADAGIALAKYVAGSHEAFVDMMNEKVKELGLSDTTHFTNCVGIYDENHYSTPYDMAMILAAAVDNPLCKEVLNARKYTTTKTEQHPDGIMISNWFLRRIEDKDTKGEVLCAKTGYVVQSGNCAASYSEGTNGRKLICVTAGSTSSWRCIYDHVAIYQQFM